MMTNKYRTTSNLNKRAIEHASGEGSKFTKKYNLIDLIYYEEFTEINQAIDREKQLKNWHHDWKVNLISLSNPKLETISL